jgi:hypothetical protein
MYLILEAIWVGVFCVVLYVGIQRIKSFLLLLFMLGFLKHTFGYLSGLESLYCNYGQACLEAGNSLRKEAYTDYILMESVIEGLVFVALGTLLYSILKNKVGVIFLLGFLLHMMAEWSGIHTTFCQENCRRRRA